MAVASENFLPGRITARRDIADGLWAIRVDPGGPFRFDPGQYATLGVETPGGLVERAYSIVSAPHEAELEFFIELVHEGELTPLLFKRRVGDTLHVRNRAKGRFLLDIDSVAIDRLLLCTVTGVAPFVSLVRAHTRDWKEGRFEGGRRVFLIHGASHSSEFGYRQELQRLATEVPWFKYVPTVSRPWSDPAWTGETGRVDDILRKYVDRWQLDPASATAHLCGHPQMIAQGKAILRRHRWPSVQVREENYFIQEAPPDEVKSGVG